MLEEEKIKKITSLLEKGGTMLASHHDCGAPLFRYQGKIVCPVCDFQEKKEIVEKKKQEPEKEIPKAVKIQPQSAYKMINEIIEKKILEIAESVESETDLQRIRDKMSCIELGIKILKLLSD